MNVDLNLKQEENLLIVEVTLPKYGGTNGKAALDVRTDTEYIRERVESLGYVIKSGTGPNLRNTRGETKGTYVFELWTAPSTSPRVEKKPEPRPKEKASEKKEQLEVPIKTEDINKLVEEQKPLIGTKKTEKQPTPLPPKKSSRTMKRRTDK